MNFFSKDETPKPAGPDPLFAATTEMEMYTNLFNKMASTCFEKCASRKHKEDDLALGEMSCADRCVSKYLEAQEKVGGVLQKANEAQIQQQQNLANMQNALGGR
jgi:import inner membrane translocase subunit TIM10